MMQLFKNARRASTRITQILSGIALLGMAISTKSHAAGFEKSVLWSGRYVGMGSAATAVVSGSEALFFNPAGLAAGTSSISGSLNFSPTFSRFDGPTSSTNQDNGLTRFSPVGGALASYKLTDKTTLGSGYFVTGGTKSRFKDINFGSTDADFNTLFPNLKTDLDIQEFSVGAGYALTEEFRVGAAWRLSRVNAAFSSATVQRVGGEPAALLVADVQDLKATRYNGFRLGAQYAPRDAGWGIGVNVRTPVHFIAKGKLEGVKVESAAGADVAAAAVLNDGAAEAESELPLQISLGGYFELLDRKLRLMPQWDFTRYAMNNQIRVSGQFNAGTGTANLSNIPLGWKNQHNFRLGAEHSCGKRLALRAGYVLTTQVTPAERARPTLASPGIGHTFTTGAGYLLSSLVSLDGALELSQANGNGINEFGQAGSFSTQAYTAHLGLNFSL